MSNYGEAKISKAQVELKLEFTCKGCNQDVVATLNYWPDRDLYGDLSEELTCPECESSFDYKIVY